MNVIQIDQQHVIKILLKFVLLINVKIQHVIKNIQINA